MKKFLLFLAAFAFTVMLSGCKDPNQTPEPVDPVTLDPLKMSVPVTENWIFSGRPTIVFHVENPNDAEVSFDGKVEIKTDLGAQVTTVSKTENIAAKAKVDISFTPDIDLPAGFYKARCEANKTVPREFVFGVNPTEIVSNPDYQEDFNSFWESAITQLENINMEVRKELIRSSSSRKIYFVEMNSIPDGLTGDPVKIRGYYCEPQDGNKHPILLHFFGYDTRPPGKMSLYTGVSDDYVEFYLSHRGQYINARTANQRSDKINEDYENIYGDWFAFQFGQRDSYYYRGAFMDCVQAVRFMTSLETWDGKNVFAEGSSQGGALSYACAALSPIKLNAIAPNVAFLGDFPDYFKIVSWPGNTAKKNKGSMTDEEMYKFLSYFDTKNLATRISSTAVLATIGLQDGTCPPHTNIAPYNNLPHNDKEIHYYPEMQHSYPPGWDGMYLKYFKSHMKE